MRLAVDSHVEKRERKNKKGEKNKSKSRDEVDVLPSKQRMQAPCRVSLEFRTTRGSGWRGAETAPVSGEAPPETHMWSWGESRCKRRHRLQSCGAEVQMHPPEPPDTCNLLSSYRAWRSAPGVTETPRAGSNMVLFESQIIVILWSQLCPGP